MRTCRECHQEKPLEAFTANKGTPWTHSRCKPCRANRNREAKWAKLPQAERQRREWLYMKRTSREPVKVCLGCGRTRPFADYTPIKGRPGAYYPRCKVCRNADHRERYHSSPEVRASEITRATRNKRPYAFRVKDVGIATRRDPEVSRSEGAPTLHLTLRGTSDARSSVDRDTRLRIALPVAQAVRLWQLLDQHLTDAEKDAASAT